MSWVTVPTAPAMHCAALTGAGHTPLVKPWPTKPTVPGGFDIDDFTVDETAGTVDLPRRGNPHDQPDPQSSPSASPAAGARCARSALPQQWPAL